VQEKRASYRYNREGRGKADIRVTAIAAA